MELSYKFYQEVGIRKQMDALKDGFCRVFPISKLSGFTPNEMRLMLCGDQNPHWTKEDLLNYTDPKLGYNKDRWVSVSFFVQFYCRLCASSSSVRIFRVRNLPTVTFR